jgi:hypothetical protein
MNSKYNITQDNHSSISSYPINYDKYPIAKNCKFIEIDLYENEYVFIPSNWMHWVFTEPFNVSMNYLISSIKYDKNDNVFLNNIKRKEPFTNKIDNKINLCFKDFFQTILDDKFSISFSTSNHLSPVKKPDSNCKTFMKNMHVRECLSMEYRDYYKYIGQNRYNNTYLNNLSNFITDANNNINYNSSVWINLDKSVNSGLHYDNQDNILVNFIGKKKVLLAHPDYRKYMYFEKLPLIDMYY